MKIPSLLDLEREQWAIIDLPFHGSHVITGSPGGGKTVMAVYRAWALATTGRDVVLITRSNLLRQHLAQLAPDLTGSITITTYHRWVREFWRERFQDRPPQTADGDWTYDWIEMQRECLLQGIRWNGYIVIDEGQNLPVGFYQLCRILGVGVTVFADENQRIGDEESAMSEICESLSVAARPMLLSKNYRNSREIARLASEFRGRLRDEVHISERIGRTPTLLKIPSIDYFVRGVSQYLVAHPRRSIGIICRTTFLVRDIQNRLTRLGLHRHTQAYVYSDPSRNTVDFSSKPITILSTASMKGLEFDSVFVPDMDAYTEDPTSVSARLNFLVLCTRARDDLHFAHRGPEEPSILSTIPDSLLTRHVV